MVSTVTLSLGALIRRASSASPLPTNRLLVGPGTLLVTYGRKFGYCMYHNTYGSSCGLPMGNVFSPMMREHVEVSLRVHLAGVAVVTERLHFIFYLTALLLVMSGHKFYHLIIIKLFSVSRLRNGSCRTPTTQQFMAILTLLGSASPHSLGSYVSGGMITSSQITARLLLRFFRLALPGRPIFLLLNLVSDYSPIRSPLKLVHEISLLCSRAWFTKLSWIPR
ncbi:hypothetical protein V6N11_069947 [Hibiscus sabdariffa]|uniref:Uncharacterized protein n=2 Tax=Hibiscus sabdariffa TaxID=183260 RepID=A0ABR2AFY9_9ROSI